MKRPRAQCPVCGRSIAMDRRGRLNKHKRDDYHWRGVPVPRTPCEGSRREVKACASL